MGRVGEVSGRLIAAINRCNDCRLMKLNSTSDDIVAASDQDSSGPASEIYSLN